MRQPSRPWELLGMSRASWYRHGKPTEKPKRYTQADVAKIFGVSLRTIQRDLASQREKDRNKVVARARALIAQGHGEEEAIATAMTEMAAAKAAIPPSASPDAVEEFVQRRIEQFERDS
jgi:hypothetical protein